MFLFSLFFLIEKIFYFIVFHVSFFQVVEEEVGGKPKPQTSFQFWEGIVRTAPSPPTQNLKLVLFFVFFFG